jgi:tRNA (cytidine/uridine-2'-O-)-methyltransferase
LFDVVLYRPEIPPNTGNVIRLCANAGVGLHLVEPLGFSLDDRQLKRAGLDYHEMASVRVHRDWAQCTHALAGRRCFAVSTRATTSYAKVSYRPGDVFLFGPETTGLPEEILLAHAPGNRIRIPMRAGNRSLNLSNAVAVVVYEAWRQQEFKED